MRTLAVAFIISLITGCSIMKSAKIMKTINQTALVNTTFLYDIPFTFRSGLVIVEGNIAPADKTLQFIFDTGAYGTVTNSTAKEYQLHKVAAATSGDANQTKGEVGVYTIPSFKLGPLEYRNVGVVGYDHPPLIACLANGGIIGAPMMKDAVWQIDIRNKHITVASEVGKLKLPPGTKKMKVRIDKFSRPFIDIVINGKKQEFLLDLGATQLVDMPEKIAAGYLNGDNNVVKVTGQGYYGAWGAVQDTITFALLDSVQLFDDIYTNIPCSYSPKSNLPVIGSELLKYYVLTLDIGHEEIYLSRYADPGTIKIESFGLDLDYKDGEVKVSRIYRNSIAEQSGIVLGDSITAINNNPVNYKNYCEFLDDKLKNFRQQSITLSIAGKNGTRQLSLKKEVFLKK